MTADAKAPKPEALTERTFTLTMPDMPAHVAVLVGDALSMVPHQQIAAEGRKLRLLAGEELKRKAAQRIIVPGRTVQ